jgi:hypothetical protein
MTTYTFFTARVSRQTFALLKVSGYLAGYLKDNLREYYAGLAAVQLRDKWSEWVQFCAYGVEAVARESIRTALNLEGIATDCCLGLYAERRGFDGNEVSSWT